MEYAVKLDDGYFKEYIYATDVHLQDRYVGIGGSTILREGDIIGVVVTQDIQRTEVRRSIGNTISTLYGIESMKGEKIEIIPIGE